MSACHWLLIVLTAMPLLSGCAVLPRPLESKPMPFAAVPVTVFVAGGAGNFQAVSYSLHKVVDADAYPIEVITFDWSHGNFRMLRDHLDFPHAQCQGKKLAAAMQDYHALHPDRPIFLLAHSAGATAAFSALENLPPNIVERGVILAPAVSELYDLRPALRAVKIDLHVFHSPKDRFFLGTVTGLIGTSDGWRAPTAGRCGFIQHLDPDEPDLAAKLIQHPWHPSDGNLGNSGGHFGSYQPDFLRARVLPLLNPTFSK